MKVDPSHKLFFGLKLDGEMRRQYEDGKLAHRPAFKPGDPARLEVLDVGGELYIGRVLDGGLAADDVKDLERNIRSIVTVTFGSHKPPSGLRIFALDRDDLASGLAAAS